MRALCAIGVVGTIFLTSTARAETGVWDTKPPCADSAGASLPSELPANIPAVPVHATPGATMRLLAPDGAVLSSKVEVRGRQQVLAIPSPLTVGDVYTVAWTADCGSGATTFKATEPRPLPTTAGTVIAGEPYFSDPGPIYTCEDRRPVGGQYVPVRFVPAPELVPFLPVSGVDGAKDGVYEVVWPVGALRGEDRLLTVSRACPIATVFWRVKARVSVAGGPDLVTPEIAVEVRCPGPLPEALCRAVDDAGPVGGSVDAGVPDGGTGELTPTTGGCATSGGGGLGLFAWVGVASASFVLATRRRRV